MDLVGRQNLTTSAVENSGSDGSRYVYMSKGAIPTTASTAVAALEVIPGGEYQQAACFDVIVDTFYYRLCLSLSEIGGRRVCDFARLELLYCLLDSFDHHSFHAGRTQTVTCGRIADCGQARTPALAIDAAGEDGSAFFTGFASHWL